MTLEMENTCNRCDCTVKTVGGLKNALAAFPDETRIRLRATGWDEECQCDLSIDPAVDEMSIDLVDCKTENGEKVLEISNTYSNEMFYSP